MMKNKIVISGPAGSWKSCLASVIADELLGRLIKVTMDYDANEPLPEPREASNRLIRAAAGGGAAVTVVVQQEPRVMRDRSGGYEDHGRRYFAEPSPGLLETARYAWRVRITFDDSEPQTLAHAMSEAEAKACARALNELPGTVSIDEANLRRIESTRVEPDVPEKLEDVFAGHVELTARQRSYAMSALQEMHIRGETRRFTDDENTSEFHKVTQVALFRPLKLAKMVTNDGSELITPEEYRTRRERALKYDDKPKPNVSQQAKETREIVLNHVGMIDRGDWGTKEFDLSDLFDVADLNRNVFCGGGTMKMQLAVDLATDNVGGNVCARVRLRRLPVKT